MTTNQQEIIEEVKTLIQAGQENIYDMEIAEEYFRDAGSVLLTIEDEKLRNEIAAKFDINPLDFI